jgi:antitoxin MazE
MKSQIGRWGNSLAIRIPKYAVEALNLNPKDVVECSVENGKLVIELIQALPELSLEELLAEVVESPEPVVDWGQRRFGDIHSSCSRMFSEELSRFCSNRDILKSLTLSEPNPDLSGSSLLIGFFFINNCRSI